MLKNGRVDRSDQKNAGLKEKSIAAARAGSKEIIIPKENARDLPKIPASVRKQIHFHPVSDVKEVLELALKEPTVEQKKP